MLTDAKQIVNIFKSDDINRMINNKEGSSVVEVASS